MEHGMGELPLSFIDRLTQATRNYQLAQEKQRELKSTIALIYKELEGININKESIDAAFPDWRNAPAATQEIEIKDLGIAWNNLNTQASGLKQSISSTAEQMARLQKDLTGFYAANPTLDEERITVLSAWSGSRIEALRASLQTLKEEEVAASTAFHLATEQMEEHIGRKPEIEENENFETLDALIANLEEKITAGNQSIGQQKLRLEENTRNIDRIKEEKERADRLREEYLKWDRLCRHFGDERGKNFRNIAQSFVLKELLAGANFYLQRLTDRYELECQPVAHHPAARLPSRRLGTSGMHLIGRRKLPGISVACPRAFFPQPPEPLGRHTVHRRRFRHTEQRLPEHRDGHIGKTAPDGRQEGRHHQHVEGLKERIKTQIQVRRIDSSRSEIKVVNTL